MNTVSDNYELSLSSTYFRPLTPEDMSGRVVYYYECALTTTLDNIEHIESQYGTGVVKIFFQPGTDVAAGQAQVTSISQTVLKQLPAGITLPQVLRELIPAWQRAASTSFVRYRACAHGWST